jgi:hypothetical protein
MDGISRREYLELRIMNLMRTEAPSGRAALVVSVLGVGFWHWLDSTLALAYSDVRLQVDFEGRAHHAGRQAPQFWTELTGEFDLLAGPEPSAAVGMSWKLSTFELGSENELDQGSDAGGPRMAGRDLFRRRPFASGSGWLPSRILSYRSGAPRSGCVYPGFDRGALAPPRAPSVRSVALCQL